MQQQGDDTSPATKNNLRQLEQTMNAQFVEVFKYMDRRFGEVDRRFEDVDQKFEGILQHMDRNQTEMIQQVGVLLETQKHDIISSTNDKISLLDDRVKRLEVHIGLVAA